MPKWFVHCNDDYDSGDLESFDKESEALEFIEQRMASRGAGASIDHYTVIYGEFKRIVPFKQVTKLAVEE